MAHGWKFVIPIVHVCARSIMSWHTIYICRSNNAHLRIRAFNIFKYFTCSHNAAGKLKKKMPVNVALWVKSSQFTW